MRGVALADKRWKVQERETARILGGQRVGPTGKATVDVLSARFGVEVKSRKSLPGWLTGAIDQAERNCPPDKAPLLVLCHCPGQGIKIRRYAIVPLAQFEGGFYELGVAG